MPYPNKASAGRPREPGQPWAIIDAAEFLGVSAKTLIRAADDGRIRDIRIARRRLLPDIEVQRLAADGLPGPE
jgi:excisionase family DNA binding protein